MAENPPSVDAPDVCNACLLYQHGDCELPNRCQCPICHPTPTPFVFDASTPVTASRPPEPPTGVLTPTTNTPSAARDLSTSGEAREPD